MPRIDEEAKGRRKELVWLEVRQHNGIRQIEIAEKLNIENRTVYNYLRELEEEGKVIKEGVLWYSLPYHETRLRRFSLSPEEAMTLYLATRLLVKQQDKRNEPAESALYRLAEVLTSDANVGHEIRQAAQELAQRPSNPQYRSIFREIIRGYIYRRKVEIRYRTSKGAEFETTFATYLIEPSAIGFSTYIIGHSKSQYVDDIRSYKMERILSAVMKNEPYTVPSGFPGLDILRNAWSIISGEKTEPVILRFSPKVKERVLETQWHPSQKPEPDPENPGYLRWRVDVADTTDMKPWIRGWGADVEVLEPGELKKELKQTAKDLASLYHIVSNTQTPSHHLFWAKADRKKEEVHLLQYHLIDVGNAALTLWKSGLNENIKQEIKDWLGLNNEDAGRLIAFWAGLHDVGKASPAFQDHPYMPPKLRKRIQQELAASGFTIPQRSDGEKRARHEIISTSTLKENELLAKISMLPALLAEMIAQTLGGHHGTWPLTELLGPAQLKPEDRGNDQWQQARKALVQDLLDIFNPPAVQDFQPDVLKDNIMLTLISGIVSVADWLGSDEESFPHENDHLPLDVYARHSLHHARYALCRVQWENAPAMLLFDFEKTFGFTPTLAQQQVIAALEQISLPAIAIIEAPMGSGKTEKAMAVYARWAKITGTSGLYVAMPTTATSNQMHTRLTDFLSTLFGKDIKPLLVHSQALLRDLPAESDAVEEKEHEGNHANAQSWFLPRKKSLLAPFGVGTVDQALMSILQTKHFFVRLLGLSHKVVVFDEVHAYDAYMSELFERLLVWLRQINVSVIILSATLPDKTRQRLIHAYAGKGTIPAKNYPRLTYAASHGKVDTIELEPPEKKILQFEWIKRDEETIIQRLSDELHEGGCAVVICNTVTRAQNLFEILSNRDDICDEDHLFLFHARFPIVWREEIENAVLKKFGPGKDKSRPNPNRPTKAIVIATQVVEQSLDLDFDVMISDHAPIDLLLQRSGRLQRHSINQPHRKQPYRLLIAGPEKDGRLPKFERGDTFVYDEHVLLRSWIVLNQITNQQIILPTDLPTLIEKVYGDDEPTNDPELLAALATANDERLKKEIEAEDLAQERMVREPNFRRLLFQPNMQLEEDDERVHKAFRALTRNGDPGLRVICLHRSGDKLYLEVGNPNSVYDPVGKLSDTMIRELARHAINVRHPDPGVEQCLLTDLGDLQVKKILTRWKRIAALRYHRVAIFENGLCLLRDTDYIMSLRKENKLGLQIYKEAR